MKRKKKKMRRMVKIWLTMRLVRMITLNSLKIVPKLPCVMCR